VAAASGDADMDDSSDVSGRHSSDRVIQKVDEDAERSGDVCVGAGKQDDIVFWTTSTTKDEKSAAKFHYIKTVNDNVVEHSIAFRVVSICWQGDDPFPLKCYLQVTCPRPLLSMVSYERCQNS